MSELDDVVLAGATPSAVWSMPHGGQRPGKRRAPRNLASPTMVRCIFVRTSAEEINTHEPGQPAAAAKVL